MIYDIAYIGNGCSGEGTGKMPFKPEWDCGSFVYRHFDADGNLLYIGVTVSPRARARHHSKKSPWFRDVVSSIYEKFGTRAEASAAEKAAIEAEHPLHNRIWNPNCHHAPNQLSKRN